MPKFIDYSNKKIGRVLILKNLKRGSESIWECLCDCSNKFDCSSRSFKRGETFECKNCLLERRRGIDLTGRKFGRWTVVGRTTDIRNKTLWIVKCDCGIIGQVATSNLGKPGKSMSCGCLGRKKSSKYVNETLYPPLHRKSRTNIYSIRTRIIHSCYKENHPSYKYYGAKGYTVCELWRNGALDFYKWCVENKWGPSHVVDIKEGETIFSPENCYIISKSKYISERMKKKVTYQGVTKTLEEWAKLGNISSNSIAVRIRRGYSIEDAIFAKPHKYSGTKQYPDMEIHKLYHLGLSMADIARKINSNYTSVGKRLRLMGINPELTGRRVYNKKQCVNCTKLFQARSANHKRCNECTYIK